MTEPVIRHRSRIREHYTVTSNVILFGYEGMTDGARLTYQLIDSYDWPDADGARKGFAYPTLQTIATIRGVHLRTIERHYDELGRRGLLNTESRPGKSSILWIEDPSQEEIDKYLERIDKPTPDKNVVGTPDKDVAPIRNTKSKKNKLVNVDKPLRTRANEPEAVADILRRHRPKATSSTVGDEEKQRTEALANELAAALNDTKSLGFYRKSAASYPQQVLWETLGEVKEIVRLEGHVRQKGALFVSLLRKREKPR